MSNNKKVTEISHPNIALIKYWGKKDIKMNIPTNSSISVLMPMLVTETSIEKSRNDEFYLDGKQHDIKDRMANLIKLIKDLARNDEGIKIVSKNSFPHSCGLASSASGFSALVKALNTYYNLNLSTQEMSKFARLGSGSACRSIETGISKWEGEYAYKIGEWDDLRIFNVVIESTVKGVSSTEGMIRTAETSSLYKYRLDTIEKKVRMAEEYINEKNFEKLGELVMRESNEVHATFLDSYPPIMYLTERSMNIINKIHKMNEKTFKAFYSFDAGPNPFIFVLGEHFNEVREYFAGEYTIIIGK